MSTLSESIRYAADHIPLRPIVPGVAQWWADKVEALEKRLDGCMKHRGALIEEVMKDSRTDTLKQNYERLGLSSALVVNNKYGKHSAFGYMGREW